MGRAGGGVMVDHDIDEPVNAREAEEMEAETEMSVGDYERKLDRERDIPLPAPSPRSGVRLSGRDVRRGSPLSPRVAVMRLVSHVGSKPRPRASEKAIESVSAIVRDRYRQMPPFDRGES